jgi:phthiocerol/phenolphthiocerol synthesis type-I polyketide synthase E
MNSKRLNDVAVIGMTGRFPKAPDLHTFWRNLCDGVEAVSFFSDSELELNGVSPALLRKPNYVRARAVLENASLFDSSFFGFSPREAELTDPQIRLFLESSWQVLETAGYSPDKFRGLIGVYAGMSLSTYMWSSLATNALGDVDLFRASIGADKDHLSTWISYKLDLQGPSFNVQTACSTSLAAVHLACQALITFECDMALAGGVCVGAPQRVGYLYQQGGISSPDGHCRAFDADADGSVGGEGVGVILLKRLEDAVDSGDTIWAVIRGSYVNNDGNRRVGYTAPAVGGQAQAIANALRISGVAPETIAYIEGHGSGTALGDPIEIAALNQAFECGRIPPETIAIGSVKTNIGHLGQAAGIAGLIKTVLSIKEGWVPPTVHYKSANPRIPFDRGPFYVSQTLSLWPNNMNPRRAGVSSFGIGGTNVHVVLEQAPEIKPSEPARPWQLLVISSRTESAMEVATDQLAEHLSQHPDINFADVAFTLQDGRKAFEHRRIAVCPNTLTAADWLRRRLPARVLSSSEPLTSRPVAFLFPGVGDHYTDMGRGLYESEPEFAAQIDYCSEFLRAYLNVDLRQLMYPREKTRLQTETGERDRLDLSGLLAHISQTADSGLSALDGTTAAQASVFVTEYALARLWMSWGIIPEAMLGYSIGEYVAACISGVVSLDDALRLVALRSRMIEQLPAGAMLAIGASEQSIAPLLTPGIAMAGMNGPTLCIVAGLRPAVEALERRILDERKFVCLRLKADHAFHTPIMEPAGTALTEAAGAFKSHAPAIPYVSNVTGTWMTKEDAADPGYWARHLCSPVRFFQGLQLVCSGSVPIMLEVGPGNMLCSLADQYLSERGISNRLILPSLPHPSDLEPDRAFILGTVGRLWLGGVEPVWRNVHAKERRRRIPLPTYPFERRHYWLPDRIRAGSDGSLELPTKVSADGSARESILGHDDPSGAATVGMRMGALETRPDSSANYVAPTSPVERKIAEIWQEVLGIYPIGLADNFFRLGGNSLLGIKAVSMLRDFFDIQLPIQVLFTANTVSDLADVVNDALLTSIEQMDDAGLSSS